MDCQEQKSRSFANVRLLCGLMCLSFLWRQLSRAPLSYVNYKLIHCLNRSLTLVPQGSSLDSFSRIRIDFDGLNCLTIIGYYKKQEWPRVSNRKNISRLSKVTCFSLPRHWLKFECHTSSMTNITKTDIFWYVTRGHSWFFSFKNQEYFHI